MKKGAIFDMDGLLFDTERLYKESWEYMAERFGQIPDPAFPPAVAGTSGDHMVEVVHKYYPDIDAQRFIARVTERVAELVAIQVPEKPGMREILEYFHQNGVRMAVASSSREAIVRNNLRQTGVEHYFDAVVSGNEVEHSKPAPDIFLLAAEQIGCQAEDCYVFEDGINGARAGVAAGCTTVMVPDQVPPTEDLLADCARICDSLHEVLRLVRDGEI